MIEICLSSWLLVLITTVELCTRYIKCKGGKVYFQTGVIFHLSKSRKTTINDDESIIVRIQHL
jgi:hypothetical protein